MVHIDTIDLSKFSTKHEAAKHLRSKGYSIVGIANKLDISISAANGLIDYKSTSPKMGSLKRHLTPQHLKWLNREVPSGMSIAEYLVEALLEDVMEYENDR